MVKTGKKFTLIFCLVLIAALTLALGFAPALAAGEPAASITVKSPNTGETLQAGSTKYITWNYQGTPGVNLGTTVTVQLVKTSDSSIITITPSAVIGSYGRGGFAWKIPADTLPGDYRIKITDTAHGIYDLSDSSFKIIAPPAITMISPGAGEVLTSGRGKYIQWSYTGTVGRDISSTVKLELLKNGAYQSNIIQSVSIGRNNLGSYYWTVPGNLQGGTDYQIRVIDSVYNINAVSKSFSINPPPASLTVTSPNSGETVFAGENTRISWKYSRVGSNMGNKVRIELVKNGEVKSTIASAASIGSYGVGSYYYAVPLALEAGEDYRIKISDTVNSSVYDISDANFTIKLRPASIKVLTPIIGEQLYLHWTRNIEWTYTGVPGLNIGNTVKIEAVRDSGYRYTVKESVPIGQAGKGSYSWSIPVDLPTGNDYRFVITDTENNSVYGVSEFTGNLANPPADIIIKTPNGGEVLQVGGAKDITWTWTGSQSKVNIDLVKYNSVTESVYLVRPLAQNVSVGSAGTGSYHWPIPTDFPEGYDYRIRITNTSSTYITDISDSDFSVVIKAPTVALTSFTTENEIVYPGTTRNITWNYGGINVGDKVDIQLTDNNGVPVYPLVADYPMGSANLGSFTWNIPQGQALGDYRIKITDKVYGYFDLSALFKITLPTATVTISSPAENEILNARTTKLIRWTYSGIPNRNIGTTVKIELLQNGQYLRTILDSLAIGNSGGNNGTSSWYVPTDIPEGSDYQLRVRVNETVYGNIYDDINVAIKQHWIQFNSPSGDAFAGGSRLTITWNYKDISSSVNVTVKRNGVTKASMVVDTPAQSTGVTYYWDIPTDLDGGGEWIITVTDSVNSAISDSSLPFTVNQAPSLEVRNPYEGLTVPQSSAQFFSWVYSGNPGQNIGTTVRIELLKGGVLATTIAASVPIGTDGDNYYWGIIPRDLPVGNDYQVRITDNLTGRSAMNSGYFTVTNYVGTIYVTGPQANQVVRPNDSTYINWQYIGVPGKNLDGYVKIDLMKGNELILNVADSVYLANGTSNTGFYSWKVPGSLIEGSDYRIKLTDKSNSAVNSVGPYFKISPATLTVMNPAAGAEGMKGSYLTIQWRYTGTPGRHIDSTIDIDLLKGGVFQSTIANAIPISNFGPPPPTSGFGQGWGGWAWPVDKPAGNDYQVRVRVTDTVFGNIYDVSNNFTIQPGMLTVTYPNNGEEMTVSQHASMSLISWRFTGSLEDLGPYVDIELLKDGIVKYTQKNVPIGQYDGTDRGAGQYYIRYGPDLEMGGGYRIRVTDSVYRDVFDLSDTDFSLIPRTAYLRLTSPASTYSWQGGSQQWIIWDYDGVIGSNLGQTVKIDLEKNGVPQLTIDSSAPLGYNGYHSESYHWSIPTSLVSGSDYRIRVTDNVYNSTFSLSNPFTIIQAPSLSSLASPVQGSVLAGTVNGSGWYLDPNGVAKLEVLVDGIVVTEAVYGDVREDVFNTYPAYKNHNAGFHFSLNTNGLLNGTHTLALRETSGLGVQTVMPAVTVTVDNSILVTPPVKGTVWQPGTTQTIRWSYKANNISAVKVDLLKNGVFKYTIFTKNSNPIWNGQRYTDSYNWVVPSGYGDGCQIRVSNFYMNSNMGISETFTIGTVANPSINITSPNSGSALTAGTTQVINWTYNGTPGVDFATTAAIYLYKDGKRYDTLASNVPVGTGGQGSYSWLVPANVVGSNFQLRLTATIEVVSENLTFGPAARDLITLTSPVGGEVFDTGSSQVVNWTFSGTPGIDIGNTVDIELIKYGYPLNVARGVNIGSNGIGSYNWTVTQYDAGSFQLRVTDRVYGNGALSGVFTIRPTMKVTKPVAGDTVKAGTRMQITWWGYGYQYGTPAELPGKDVKIEFLKDGQPVYTGKPVMYGFNYNAGQAYLMTPGTFNGPGYQVRLTSNIDPACTATSDPFSFSLGDPLRVDQPKAGYAIGGTYPITWSYSGTPGVDLGTEAKIELLDSVTMTPRYVVTPGTPVGGGGITSFDWTIPSTVSAGTYFIKVTDTVNEQVYDITDSSFSIGNPATSIKITSPTAGELPQAGTTIPIQWNYTGGVGPSVKIILIRNSYLNSTHPTTTIINSTPTGSNGSGSYSWAIPSNISGSDFILRVIDTGNPNLYGELYYTINPAGTGNITLTAPNGGETLETNKVTAIRWNYTGTVGTNTGARVKIELLRWGSYNSTLASDTGIGSSGTGSFDWQVPGTLESGGSYQIRITDLSTGAIDLSNTYFNVTPGTT